MIGRVVSVKSQNTVSVLVERTAMHPLYKKTYKQSKKYLADDQIGVKLGDIVEFINCKPISKRKSFKVVKVLGKNFAEIAEIELKEKAEQAISEVMPEEKVEEKVVEQSEAEESGQPKSEKPKKAKAKKETK